MSKTIDEAVSVARRVMKSKASSTSDVKVMAAALVEIADAKPPEGNPANWRKPRDPSTAHPRNRAPALSGVRSANG